MTGYKLENCSIMKALSSETYRTDAFNWNLQVCQSFNIQVRTDLKLNFWPLRWTDNLFRGRSFQRNMIKLIVNKTTGCSVKSLIDTGIINIEHPSCEGYFRGVIEIRVWSPVRARTCRTRIASHNKFLGPRYRKKRSDLPSNISTVTSS
jgi:hypothetical protein